MHEDEQSSGTSLSKVNPKGGEYFPKEYADLKSRRNDFGFLAAIIWISVVIVGLAISALIESIFVFVVSFLIASVAVGLYRAELEREIEKFNERVAESETGILKRLKKYSETSVSLLQKLLNDLENLSKRDIVAKNNIVITVGNGSTFHLGSLEVVNNFQQAYDRTQNEKNADRKAALELLTTATGRLLERIDGVEKQVAISEQCATLVEEASKETPSKWKVEASAEGLISAARTVAELSAPIVTAVKAVRSIIDGTF